MTELDDYTEKVIREAENMAYSTRLIVQEGIPLSVIARENMTPYETITTVLEIALKQTPYARRKLDLEELSSIWKDYKEAIMSRYPK